MHSVVGANLRSNNNAYYFLYLLDRLRNTIYTYTHISLLEFATIKKIVESYLYVGRVER
jgi:hypothetical protein